MEVSDDHRKEMMDFILKKKDEGVLVEGYVLRKKSKVENVYEILSDAGLNTDNAGRRNDEKIGNEDDFFV